MLEYSNFLKECNNMKYVIKRILGVFALVMIFLVTIQEVRADTNQTMTKEQYQKELQNASAQMLKALKQGPVDIPVLNLATLNLPAGYSFIPAREAKNYLQLLGSKNLNNVVGMVISSADEDNDWMVLISYIPSGHIMDDDAKNWNSDDLLKSIQQATKEANAVRKERGFAELNILGWSEKPHYDAQTNRLEWSIKASQETSANHITINYTTLALSKEGYISINLVTGADQIAAHQSIPKTLLASLNLKEGNRYSDFNAKTDKVAEYGLAALITGVAAKKLGLIAVVVAFLAKFAKIIIAFVVGGGILVSKVFKRKKETPPTNHQETDKEKPQDHQ